MTNYERYRDEIERLFDEFEDFAVTKDGEIVQCDGSICDNCLLATQDSGKCTFKSMIDWCTKEYVPPERGFTCDQIKLLEILPDGWLVRDVVGNLWWSEEDPAKKIHPLEGRAIKIPSIFPDLECVTLAARISDLREQSYEQSRTAVRDNALHYLTVLGKKFKDETIVLEVPGKVCECKLGDANIYDGLGGKSTIIDAE